MVKKAKRVDHFLGSIPLQYRDGLGRRATKRAFMVSAVHAMGAVRDHSVFLFEKNWSRDVQSKLNIYIYIFLITYL